MKSIFYYVCAITFLSCGSSKFSNQQLPVGEGYKIPAEDAEKMLSRLNKCGLFHKCTGSGDGFEYDPEYKYIIDKYGAANVTTVLARYRKADQKFYTKIWGLDPKSEDAKVKGFKTSIIEVELPGDNKDKPKPKPVYYSLVKLCPPPPHCPDSIPNFKIVVIPFIPDTTIIVK